MSTYTQILYQIVFCPKYRTACLSKANRDELYKYISGILKSKKCHLYRINGIEDHIHIVCSIHPSVSVSSLVKDIKVSSSLYIKQNELFLNFDGWQKSYGAFTYSIKEKDRLIEYVKNQEEHHKKINFKDEYLKLLKKHEVEFNEKYLL
jgi:putative transposase